MAQEQESLQEITRYSVPVNKNEEPQISWHNSFLTIKQLKGLNVYELIHSADCLDKKVTSLESFIDSSKTSPASDLFTDKIINAKLSNMEVQEMVMDTTLWPHNPQLLQEDTCVKDFQWSPFGLVDNHQSVLAVLNNVGGIDLHVKRQKWHCLLEMAKVIGAQFATGTPSSFEHLTTAVHTLASTAICWAPSLNEDNSCFLATGQKNGFIMFWLISTQHNTLKVVFIECIETMTNEIVSMLWIPKPNNKFYLVCSDVFGQITLLNCQIDKINIKLVSSHILWPYKDKMLTNVHYLFIGNKTLLFCSKNRHFLVLLIGNNLNVKDKYVHNINDYRISSVSKHNEHIYVTLINGHIYKVINEISEQNKLKITYNEILSKDIVQPTHEVYGFSRSHNGVICALALIDRKVLWRKVMFKIDVVLMSNHTIESLVNILLENPSRKLTYYIDVIELLRYKCMKQKHLPISDFNDMYKKCSTDLYLLKVYLILIKLYSNIEKCLRLPSGMTPAIKTPQQIKTEILMLHAENIIRSIHRKYIESGQLSVFESEMFVGAKKFLSYYFKINNLNLYDILSYDILNIVNNSDFVYTCQCCDLSLNEFMCENNHLNMYCMISLTPINGDSYLTCKWCDSTARSEFVNDSPLCLYCDVSLNLVE